MSKIQRNEKCFCGSGLKFKFCHGNTSSAKNGNEVLTSSHPISEFKDSNSNTYPSESQHYQNALNLCKQVEVIRRTQPNHILNSFQTGIFNEIQLDNPEIQRTRKIASQIREGVEHVNGGGCGLFALLLQSFVGGEIYHISLAFKLNGEYQFYGTHEFLITDGICYDADSACKESTLMKYKQPMRKANSEAALRKTKPTTTYCLYNMTKAEIIEKYKKGEYLNVHCSDEDKSRMIQNAVKLSKKMKNVIIEPEIANLFKNIPETKDRGLTKYLELKFWISLFRKALII